VRGAKANIDTTTAWLDDAWAAAYEALDDANQTVPSYAIVPPSLLKFHVVGQPCPLGEKSALRRTAKGGIVRRDVERRFGSWLDQTLAAAANMRARIGQGDDSNATGTRRSILGGVESVCPSSAAQGASGAAEALDSLGLTALAFKRNSSSRMASAHSRAGEFPLSLDPFDALLQHVKVALLLPVLLRHLQRFTVHTCHEFDSMLVSSALICTLNNILQTGAVEGLAFLSGAAIAHQRMTGRQVLAPLLLLTAFRHVFHPLVELATFGSVAIGTAHLWFILMLGVARGIIFVLNLLPRHSALGRYAPLALASVVAALRLIYFRGEGAHIGFRSFTYIRKFIYYACFGDRNYQQASKDSP